MQGNIPAFFYFNKVILLDDDKEFVDTTIEYLKNINKNIKIEGCINPDNLQINENYNVKSYIQTQVRDDIEKNTLSYDLVASFNNAFNSNKDEVSILVVDYDMPSIDGISLIKKLNNHNVYKILLTGTADEDIAVKAFNDGLIDSYIKKQEPDALKKLYNKIIDFHLRFFQKETDEIIKAILKVEENSLLNSPEYKELLYKIIKDNNIYQYYLIDEIGSYYMISNSQDYIMYITEESKNLALAEYLEEKNINNAAKEEFYNFVSNIKNTSQIVYDQLVYHDLINDYNYKNYRKKSNKLIVNNKKYSYFFSENRTNDKKGKIFNNFIY
jgi:FixJ family two-component response regulator